MTGPYESGPKCDLGRERRGVDETELREIERRVLVGCTDDAHEVIHHLGHTEHGQPSAVNVVLDSFAVLALRRFRRSVAASSARGPDCARGVQSHAR